MSCQPFKKENYKMKPKKIKHGKCCKSHCHHTNSKDGLCMSCGVTERQLKKCWQDPKWKAIK